MKTEDRKDDFVVVTQIDGAGCVAELIIRRSKIIYVRAFKVHYVDDERKYKTQILIKGDYSLDIDHATFEEQATVCELLTGLKLEEN
jgi:hypothetical protein